MSTLAVVPDWWADESLYSWAAGYHALHGHGSARRTGFLLFGSEHASKERDAPKNLHHFLTRTAHLACSVESLLRERTRAGLYLQFTDDAHAVLAKGASAGWRVALGMAASGLDPVSRLRHCPDCAKQDAEQSGLARWRIKHQYPGCWVCTEHMTPLTEHLIHGQEWSLPSDRFGDGRSGMPQTNMPMVALAHLANLCRMIASGDKIDLNEIRTQAFARLREHGITGWAKPLSDLSLSQWFRSTPLSHWLQKQDRHVGTLADGLWIYRLLRRRTGDHPLRWLIFWSALEADLDPKAIARRLTSPFVEPHWGVDGQGLIWSTKPAGIPAELSSHLVDGKEMKQLIADMRCSQRAFRSSAKGNLGQGLRALKEQEQARQRLVDSTQAIQSYMDNTPGCSRNQVLQQCKVHTEWLRRHSPATLEAILPAHASMLRAQLNLF